MGEATLSLTLVTLAGEQKLQVQRDATVEALRDLVHKVGCPLAPERQRIVYRGREIKDCTLEQAGVVDNSSFVVVERRAHVGTSRPAIESSPAKELIHEMTTKLAEQKGNLLSRSNSTAAVGQDRSARSALASISDIQQLLNAITTDVDHNITDNPLWRDSGLAGERGEDGEGTVEEGEDGEDSISLEERESGGNETLPEANPTRLQQLVEMGFSEALARKALILRHNNLDLAMDWVLEHQDDPEAETPLTESQLRRIAISRRRQRRNRRRFRTSWPNSGTPVDQELLVQLGEMGFSENLSRFALETFNNNMELACQWLLASADDFESEPEAESGGSPRNEGSDEGEDDASGGGGRETSTSQVVQQLQELGDALQDSRWLRLRSLASPNPTMQQERLMHAFQAMIENPREARSYLTDPEIGPILLQVQRAQRVSSGITPIPEPRPDAEGSEEGAQEEETSSAHGEEGEEGQ